MTERGREFSYTGSKGDYLSAIAGWLIVLGIEGSVVALLIVVFASGWWRLGLLALFLGAMALAIFHIMLRPLFTRHAIDDDHVTVHFGRTTFPIPLAGIREGIALERDRRVSIQGAPQVDNAGKRLIVAFSREGLVELRLNDPIPYEDRDGSHLVTSVVLNVDDREGFLAAVKPHTTIAAMPPGNTPSPDISRALATPARRVRPAASRDPALRVRRLTRTFGDLSAVDDISFDLYPGEILGCIGGNGAGKTTTIKMLVGLIRPDSGTIASGRTAEPDGLKAQLGYVADKPILYERLTGQEFLSIIAQMRAIPTATAERRIDELLEMLGLTAHRNRLCGSYSYGMKRKLSLAAAVLHRPRVLILDEPLNGLDPVSARRVKTLLRSLAEDNDCAIFVSMHDLATIESLCDRVLVMHNGGILVDENASDLMARTDQQDLESAYLSLIDDGRAS